MVRALVSGLVLSLTLAAAQVPSVATTAQSGGTARVRTRSYFFKEAGHNSDYKLFVSTKYQADTPAPLVVALHPFNTAPQGIMLYQGLMDLAEARGYIVVAPSGHNLRAWYGPGGELSELDMLNVLSAVRAQYTVDSKRIYLMGHSMGGGATWYFGMKYPDLWAAIAPVAPAISLSPDDLVAIKGTSVIVVQGDSDPSVNVEATRRWIAKMKELGMTYEYVEISGGDHTSIISRSPENMQRIFDFFDKARRK
ncbi:MAG: prolyl oligopeptidase family serine peptidase [Vicinamibacterales bacterium]